MTHSAPKDTPRALSTIFLDRDGVLNEKMPEGSYVRTVADFHPLPGVAEAIGKLNRAGMRVVVVSNQRGIALVQEQPMRVGALVDQGRPDARLHHHQRRRHPQRRLSRPIGT